MSLLPIVENNIDLFKTFAEWGVKGVKIDFMDRSDQWMVNYYERVAAEAAKHKLFVNYHGSFKPAGLEYKYPNVLSYEGVRGMEQMGGCTPDNSIYPKMSIRIIPDSAELIKPICFKTPATRIIASYINISITTYCFLRHINIQQLVHTHSFGVTIHKSHILASVFIFIIFTTSVRTNKQSKKSFRVLSCNYSAPHL